MSNDHPTWDGCERRVYMKNIHDVEAEFNRALEEHEEREKRNFEEGIANLKKDAFPDSPAAHRIAHQAMIDAANSEADFWRGLKLEIAKKSIWGVLQILLILAVAGVAAKFGLAPSAITWLSK